MKKRGQITIFIVLGLILVIAAVLFFAFQRAVVERELPREEKVAPNLVPIQNHVKQCVYDTAKQGLYLLGQQGGYINIPDFIKRNPNRNLALVPGSEIIVPYWFFDGISRPVSIEFMQAELEDYLVDHIDECVNFEAFSDSFEISKVGLTTATVLSGEEEISVSAVYPIEVKNKADESVSTIRTYNTAVDVRLKDLQKLAAEILNAENEGNLLESMTIDLVVLDPNVPVSDLYFSCRRDRWQISEIEASLKETIRQNLRLVRVRNAEYSFPADESEYKEYDEYDEIFQTQEDLARLEPGAGPFKTARDFEDVYSEAQQVPELYAYKHYLFDAGFDKYRNVTATLKFEDYYPFLMRINPSDGPTVYSSMGKGPQQFLSLLCLNFYQFTYDLLYPVEVALHDDLAYDGEGYTFRYAFSVIIKSNAPNRGVLNLAQFQPNDFDEGFCSDARPETFTITASDFSTGEMLKDVNITFECGKFFCPLGKTDLIGNIYALNTNLPSGCIPGSIRAEKEGYLDKLGDLTGAETSADIKLKPFKELNFSFALHESTNLDAVRGLESDEKVYMFYRVRAENFENTIIYPGEELNITSISFVDDTELYDFEIIVSDDKLDNKAGFIGNFTLTHEDLIGRSSIVFHLAEKIPVPISDEEQLQFFAELQNATYNELLKPELR